MFTRKTVSLIVIVSSIFYFTGCNEGKPPIPKTGYYHSGIYFGKNFSANYQQGIADGCRTSKGKYTKSHTLFNKSQDYNNGWFLGRNKCKHLLVIEEDEKKLEN